MNAETIRVLQQKDNYFQCWWNILHSAKYTEKKCVTCKGLGEDDQEELRKAGYTVQRNYTLRQTWFGSLSERDDSVTVSWNK